MRYVRNGDELLPQRDDLKPLILTRDCNVNFALYISIKLIDFLQQQLKSLMYGIFQQKNQEQPWMVYFFAIST